MFTTPHILRSAILTVFLGLSATFGIAAPSISSISPSSGATQGGTAITINGSGFVSNPPSTFVTLGGASMAITSITDTRIIATTPAGQGTGKQLTVIVSGVISNAATFSYLPPAINSFTPATFATSGGTLLTLTGSNFGLTPTVTAGSSNFSVISNNHSSITCIVPAGQGSSIPLTVITAGQTSNSVSISYTPPAITSITPSSGSTAGGTLLTITGSNFGTSSIVSIGVTNAQVISQSHTQLLVTSPPGEGTNRSVTVNAGGQVSNSVQFSYNPPTISGITPASAGTAGGTTITLTGTNFGLTPEIGFNGQFISPTSSSHTQAVFLLPAGQGTGIPVSLRVAGQTSNPVTFNYSAPVITSVSPSSGPTQGGTVITINGNNFGTNPVVNVGVNEAALTGTPTHTQILCTLPPGQGGNQAVTVTAGNQQSNSQPLDYDAPEILSITPANGATSGSTVITINGKNFGLSGTVSIGGVNAPVTSGGYSHTTITCTLPAGQGTNLPVVVNSAGRLSNSVSFSYNPPTISGISPATGPTAGGALITLTGSGFGTNPTVLLNNSPVSLVSQSHGEVVFELPAGEGRNLPVTVSAGGQVSSSTSFSYGDPVLTSITAASYPTAGAVPITLTGSNFGLNPTVRVGSSVAPLVTVASTHGQLVCTLPAGQGIGKSVTVTVAGTPSNALTLDYDAPEIFSITPASANTSGATTITITGKNFGLSGMVSIGGVNAPVTLGAYSHTAITCTLPAGQGANLPVVVTTEQRSSNSVSFSYNPPTISGISPATGPTAGGTLITLTGSNFGISPVVLFGSSQVSPGSSSHGQLVFELPPGEGGNLPVRISAGGQVSSSISYSYGDPTLTSITAASYPTAGTIPITLTGSNFGINPLVRVGSSVAPVVSIASDHSQIVCTLPAGQGIGKSVTVTVAGKDTNSLSLDYDAPVITGISPAGASTSGGTTITITGRNFGSTEQSVAFGSQTITQFSSASHTQLVLSAPPGQGSSVPVQVSVDGRLSAVFGFGYLAPAITGISAAAYPTSGGTVITITGTNFGLNHTVLIGGQGASLQPGSSHTQVTCTLPAGQGTNVPVVLAAGGQVSPAAFINYDAPAITSISPGNGPTSGGVPITINGSNFGLTPGVSLGGKEASTVSITHSRIVFTLPSGGGADRQLTVTTEGQVSNVVLFDYDGDTFSSWSDSIAWNGLDSSPGADPRQTGWENVLAYALGVDPITTTGGETASRLPRVYGRPAFTRDSSGRLQISFWRRRGTSSPDLVYQVQFSNNPGAESWDPPAADPQIEVVDATWEFCTFRDAETTGTTRFGRVKVELVTPP